jgi:hypothetical protein
MGPLNGTPERETATIETDGVAPSKVGEPEIRLGLKSGGYPWYDAQADSARPVLPYEASPPVNWGKGFNLPNPELVLIGLAVLVLSVFLIAMVGQWRQRRRPPPADEAGGPGSEDQTGAASRIDLLPPEARTRAADPWAEAARLRDAGDLAGSVVCLFAAELIALDRAALIRPAPGRTGRQLMRSIEDRPLRDAARPTLALFEAAAYGHRRPSPADFDKAWAAAHWLRDRLAGGAPR